MRKALTVLIASALVVGCGSTNEAPTTVDQEIAKIQGTWLLASTRADGNDLPPGLLGEYRATFTGNKKTVRLGDQELASDVLVEIDPSASPRIWDESATPDKGEKVMIRGIYKLDGDTLTKCIASADQPRPTELASRPGSGHTLQVFHRVNAVAGH